MLKSAEEKKYDDRKICTVVDYNKSDQRVKPLESRTELLQYANTTTSTTGIIERFFFLIQRMKSFNFSRGRVLKLCATDSCITSYTVGLVGLCVDA